MRKIGIAFGWEALWLDELPEEYTYESDSVLKKTMEVVPIPHQEPRKAAVEINRHPGHPNSYGLLGGTFLPDGGSSLHFNVVTLPEPPGYTPNVQSEQFYTGLIREYAPAALLGATQMLAGWPLGGGVLSFHCARHHLVSSSPFVFAFLARSVVAFLPLKDNEISDEEAATRLAALWKLPLPTP